MATQHDIYSMVHDELQEEALKKQVEEQKATIKKLEEALAYAREAREAVLEVFTEYYGVLTSEQRSDSRVKFAGDVIQQMCWWFFPNEGFVKENWPITAEQNVTVHQHEGAALAFGSPADPPPSKRMKKGIKCLNSKG